MTIDITAYSGAAQQIQVIRPHQKPNVIDLGHSGSKELNCTGDQVIIVLSAESVVEGAIHLIQIQVTCGCSSGLPAFAVAPLVNRFDQAVDFLRAKQPGRAVRALSIRPDVDYSNSIVCIEHGDGIAGTHFKPALQMARVASIQRV